MKTISIPYYTSTLDLHVDEANLKAVVTAKSARIQGRQNGSRTGS